MVLKPQWVSESPRALINMWIADPHPEFWGQAQELVFLTNSQTMLYCWSRDHALGTAGLSISDTDPLLISLATHWSSGQCVTYH